MEAEKKSLPSTSGTQSFAESVIARKKAEEMARRAEEEEDEVEREAEEPEVQESAAMTRQPRPGTLGRIIGATVVRGWPIVVGCVQRYIGGARNKA